MDSNIPSLDTQESTNHTQEYHNNSLQQLCRLCACRLQTAIQRKNKNKARKIFSVEKKEYAEAIKQAFNIDVTKDKRYGENIFPKSFCNACRMYMYVTRKSATPSEQVEKRMAVDQVNLQWNGFPHDMENCFACCTFNEQSTPGRRKKKPPKPPVRIVECGKCNPGVLKDMKNILRATDTQDDLGNQRHVNRNISNSFPQATPAPMDNQELPSNDSVSTMYNSTSIQDYLEATKGEPVSELDKKILSCILAKYGKHEPIQVPTGGQVSNIYLFVYFFDSKLNCDTYMCD